MAGPASGRRAPTLEHVDMVFLRRQEWKRAILADGEINCPTLSHFKAGVLKVRVQLNSTGQ
jgi:hypothetical protein